jgi:hypothetical protein
MHDHSPDAERANYGALLQATYRHAIAALV